MLGVFSAKIGKHLHDIPASGATRQIAAMGPDHILLGLRKGDSKLTVINMDGDVAWESDVLGRMIHSAVTSPDGNALYATTSDKHRVFIFTRD